MKWFLSIHARVCLSCLITAYLPISQPFREGHWLVQPLSRRTMSELHRSMFRWAAAHRKLPATEDHWQGKLCQGQTGTTHIDWARGRFNANMLQKAWNCTQMPEIEELMLDFSGPQQSSNILWLGPQLVFWRVAPRVHITPLSFDNPLKSALHWTNQQLFSV